VFPLHSNGREGSVEAVIYLCISSSNTSKFPSFPFLSFHGENRPRIGEWRTKKGGKHTGSATAPPSAPGKVWKFVAGPARLSIPPISIPPIMISPPANTSTTNTSTASFRIPARMISFFLLPINTSSFLPFRLFFPLANTGGFGVKERQWIGWTVNVESSGWMDKELKIEKKKRKSNFC
jgi:hypothetical protein